MTGGADAAGGSLGNLAAYDLVKDRLVTTMACGEEIPNPFC